MEKKKKIKIDYDELEIAYDFGSYELEYYLDLETGETILISDAGEVKEETMEGIENDLDRFIRIPTSDSHEGYKDMADFLDTIENKQLQKLLTVALDGKGAFGRFKNVLYDYPEEQKRWYAFKADRTRERIIKWLESLEIEYELN